MNVRYHAGSKNEKPGRTGFSHLFEQRGVGQNEERRGENQPCGERRAR